MPELSDLDEPYQLAGQAEPSNSVAWAPLSKGKGATGTQEVAGEKAVYHFEMVTDGSVAGLERTWPARPTNRRREH